MDARRGRPQEDPAGAGAGSTAVLALDGAVPAPPAPRSRKGGPRPVPERQEGFAHLSLEQLRAYRRALGEEEGRVSYWRRIIQARLDVLRAALDGGTARDVDTDALRPVLTDARVGAGRQALLEVVPVDDVPPLPHLEELWERPVDLGDELSARGLEADLAAAERQLSDYRSALHRQIAAATGELIARYREQPALCLSVLPLPVERRLAAG